MGDEGPAGVKVSDVKEWVFDECNVIEEDRGGKEKEASGDGGWVRTRASGCWRMRPRPDAPNPCSYSERMGDKGPFSWNCAAPPSKEKRIRVFPEYLLALARRFPVLRFFGRLSGTCCDSASS